MVKLRAMAGSSVAIGGLIMLLQLQWQSGNLWAALLAGLFMLLGLSLALADDYRRKLPIKE